MDKKKRITIKLNQPEAEDTAPKFAVLENRQYAIQKKSMTEENHAENVVEARDGSPAIPFQYESLQYERPQHEQRPTSHIPHLPLRYQQKRKKQKREWSSLHTANYQQSLSKKILLRARIKVILVTAAAVSLGVVMGMMVLSIFSNLESSSSVPHKQESSQSSPSGVGGDQEKIVSIAGEQEVTGTGDHGDSPLIMPSGHVEGRSIELPARSYYVVQAGAFSDLGMAQEVSQAYQGKGWASLLLDDQSPYRLYTGVVMNREDALLLGTFYHEQKVEIYVKEHQVPHKVATIKQGDEQALATLPAFLAKGDQLLAFLGQASTSGIVNQGMTVSEEEWKQIQELHRTFLQEGQRTFDKWSGEALIASQRMQHALTEGIDALERYRKQQHSAYLWKVQQSSLNYLQAYERFLANL